MTTLRTLVCAMLCGSALLAAWNTDALSATPGSSLDSSSTFVLSVSPNPIQSGKPFSVVASGGNPDSNTHLFYSVDDPFLCAIYVTPLQTNLNMCTPNYVRQPLKTDAAGMATWSLNAPSVAVGHRVRFQALQFQNSSAVADVTILP